MDLTSFVRVVDFDVFLYQVPRSKPFITNIADESLLFLVMRWFVPFQQYFHMKCFGTFFTFVVFVVFVIFVDMFYQGDGRIERF